MPDRVAQKCRQSGDGQSLVEVWRQAGSSLRADQRREMGSAPFASVGEQVSARQLEIAATEGLQRMLGGALGEHLAGPARRQVVTQLRHQHRRRLFAVVARAAPGPADVEHAPGRQQRFEHQLSVIVATGSVTGALLAGPGHQVEIAACAAARKVAVVHAQQAQHFERQRAHGQQCAEGHPAGLETARQCGFVDTRQPSLARHGKRHRLVETRCLAGRQPSRQRSLQRGDGQAFTLVGRRDHGAQQQQAARCPVGRRGRNSRQRRPLLQRVDQRRQRAGDRGL